MMKKRVLAAATLTIAAMSLIGCSAPNKTAPPAEEQPVEEVETVEDVAPAEPDGTSRENPLPLGSSVTSGDWTITINSVNLNANDLIVDDFNEPPAEGNVYIMVNATVTYDGDNPQGEVPMGNIDYVTADGNTIGLAWVDFEDTDFTLLDPLYGGASHTGSNAYEVPADTAAEGTLAVAPDMMGEASFVAVK